MNTLFLKLVNLSLTASILILVIIVLRLIFKKAPKWLFCVLWGLVAVRLIIPFSFESKFSLVPSAEPIPSEITVSENPQINSGIRILDNAINPIISESFSPAVEESANPLHIWTAVLSWIWLSGLIAMLLYAVVSTFLLKRKLRTATPYREGIKQSEAVESPFVFGILRPVIYLPYMIEENDIIHVIAHEKAHIERKDHLWKPLGFIILSVYWFNPLMWPAYILLCRDIESACDEKVASTMDKKMLRAYSTALLNCSVNRKRIAACPIAFGEVGVKERIKNIINYKKPTLWIIIIAVLTCIVVAVCFLTSPKREYQIPWDQFCFNETESESVETQLAADGKNYIADLLNKGKWTEGLVPEFKTDYKFYFQSQTVGYNYNNGIFVDFSGVKNMMLTEKERIKVNKTLGLNSVITLSGIVHVPDSERLSLKVIQFTTDKPKITVEWQNLDAQELTLSTYFCLCKYQDYQYIRMQKNDDISFEDIAYSIAHNDTYRQSYDLSAFNFEIGASYRLYLNDSKPSEYWVDFVFDENMVFSSDEQSEKKTNIEILKKKYPEYFNIDSRNGFDVIVWEMAHHSYSFALLPHSEKLQLDSLIYELKLGVNAEQMKTILSFYNIDEKDIHIIPYQHPLSSYISEYWIIGENESEESVANKNQQYIENIKEMLFS